MPKIVGYSGAFYSDFNINSKKTSSRTLLNDNTQKGGEGSVIL